eukprot:4148224-Pyramimonas_sp.AAC.1
MEGTTHGITFACVNVAARGPAQGGGGNAKKEEGKEAELVTYAIRFREKNAGEQVPSSCDWFSRWVYECLSKLVSK